MNSNCSLLIFLINSQRDVLWLSVCVWTKLNCHATGLGTRREGGHLQPLEETQDLCLLAWPADPIASSPVPRGAGRGPWLSPLLPWA